MQKEEIPKVIEKKTKIKEEKRRECWKSQMNELIII